MDDQGPGLVRAQLGAPVRALIRARWLPTLSAALLLLVPQLPAAQRPAAGPVPLEVLVERAYDGHSLRLAPVDGSATIEARLAGIEAPEPCQPGGAEAHLFLVDLVVGRHLRWVADRRQPRDSRSSWGRAWLGDEEINRRVVAEGHAWSERIKWDRGPYVAQERMARSLRRGLHRDPAALRPAEFRARHGPCRQP